MSTSTKRTTTTPTSTTTRPARRTAASACGDQLPWLLRPYLKANIWQDFVGADRTSYGGWTNW